MKLLDKVFQKNKVEKMIAETISVAEDEDIYKAKERFLSMLEKHPELRKELLLELGVRVDDDEQTPNELLDKVALEITKSEEIPDSVIDDTVSDKLTDDGIKDLILKGNLSIFRQELLAREIQNSKLKKEMGLLIEKRREKNKTEEEKQKEKEDYQKLWKIYQKSPDLTEWDIVNGIENINANAQDKKSQSLIKRIVAKKMAYNYLNYKTTTIPTLANIMSVEEMFGENMPALVENEWEQISDDNKNQKEQKYSYKQEDLRSKLLKYIAKKSVNSYLEAGRFYIPQSELMHNITQKEEQDFYTVMEKELGYKLTRIQLKDVRAQIRGIIVINDDIERFEENLINIPKESLEKYLRIFTELLNDDSYISVLEMLQNTGIMQQLKNMPMEQRKKVVQGFSNVLKHRENQIKNSYHVSKASPVIKCNSKIKNLRDGR